MESAAPDQNSQSESTREQAVSELDQYLSDLIRKSFGGDLATSDASAPILLPDKEDLTVRLVSQQSLERLRDAESDRSVFDNLLWCLLGGMIGFFTNVATGGKSISVQPAGYVFLVFMAASVLATLIMRRRLVRRLNEARRRVHVDKGLPHTWKPKPC
jgi:hypothetical protein